MTEKQVLAALQIESNEVRLIVGEVFNTRLNVLTVESAPCKGLDGTSIRDTKLVGKAIRQVVNNAAAYLGTPITGVLLAIPAYRFKKETRTFSKVIESADRKVTSQDIRDIYRKAMSVNVGDDYIAISATSNNYRMNGITYRKMPIGEKCDILEADVDILCCDRLLTYDYATAIEQADLEIIDICLDNYAIAKEAALFEKTMKKYVLSIQFERNHTLFSLIYNGKIQTSLDDNVGYYTFVKPISEKFGLPERNSYRLLQRYVRLDQKEFNNKPIYSWTVNNITSVITDRELSDAVTARANTLADDFYITCQQILQQENVTCWITGAGAEISGIDKLLAEKFDKPVKCYFPETLGARDSKWTVCLGTIYSYIDMIEINGTSTSSVDEDEFANNLRKNLNDETRQDGFTARLKKLLFNS